MLAFTVLALDSQARHSNGQDNRQRVMDGLKTWVDWEAILRSIAPDNRTAPPESPGYKPRTYKGVDRPPYLLLRATKALAVGRTTTGRAGCKDDPLGSRPPSSSRESDEDDRSGARTPPPNARGAKTG